MAEIDPLTQIRDKIDALDLQLLTLLSQRAGFAQAVAKIKQEQEGGLTKYYRPEREAHILRTMVEKNNGPLSNDVITRLFREIISSCLALEQRTNIAYLGPKGTFTEEAALKHFGYAVYSKAYPSIDQVFYEVESEHYHYGVVPIENSTEGVVNYTLDKLIYSDLLICGEVVLRIHQHLLGKTTELKKIKRIYSHQQSFAQCRAWLNTHLPDVEQIMTMSNAEAASQVQSEDTAAIAGKSAAEQHHLKEIMSNIEDDSNNTTRFLILGKDHCQQSHRDKTSLLFSIPNKVGGLQQVLTCFSENQINMSRLESRPSRLGVWNYLFFVDVEGHIHESKLMTAIEQLRERAGMVKWLGSYPQAI